MSMVSPCISCTDFWHISSSCAEWVHHVYLTLISGIYQLTCPVLSGTEWAYQGSCTVSISWHVIYSRTCKFYRNLQGHFHSEQHHLARSKGVSLGSEPPHPLDFTTSTFSDQDFKKLPGYFNHFSLHSSDLGGGILFHAHLSL